MQLGSATLAFYGIGAAAVTGTERAAVRSVAACAATALILVCAQDVNCRGPVLCHHQACDGEYEYSKK